MLSEARPSAHAEWTLPAAPFPLQPPGAPAESLLDALDIEALALNLDASLRVHARSHFFTWTQGLLQSLLCHDVLACLLFAGGASSFRVECFCPHVADAAIFSDPLLRDISLTPRLVEAWQQNRHRPVLIDPVDAGILARTAFGVEIERVGATQVLVHGCHDVDGEAVGLFVFACKPGSVGPRQLYSAQLVVPFLHAAWVRSQMPAQGNSRGAADVARHSDAVVTSREQEILKWIYLGKSNAEIGMILAISPLTVKNHVQNLLRKLNVVNRAQAVGKALDARILKP
jgi:transcriptional regulator EpsA